MIDQGTELTIGFRGRVPYYAQVASPDLAGTVFSGAAPAESDPRWAETGAADVKEYVFWTTRACGAVCVKMATEALGSPKRPLMDTIRAGLELGAYLFGDRTKQGAPELGWSHQGLADMLRRAGYAAESRKADLAGVVELLRRENLLIASVSYELGTGLPVTKNRGHLVLITGALIAGGACRQVRLHNPSGRTADLRENALIPAERFERAFSNRIILIKTGKN